MINLLRSVVHFAKPERRISDPNIFLRTAASVAVSVDPKDIKTILANGFNIFFIKGKPVFSNGLRSPPEFWIL